MKHKLLFRRFVASLLLLAVSTLSWAYVIEVDGISYDINSGGTVTVVSGGYSGSLTIPSSVTYGGTNYSVTRIGDEAFSGCSGLTSINIPESVTSIGDYAFYGCKALTKAEFASIESLCKISFDTDLSNPLSAAHHLYVNGDEVKNLVIPNSVTHINDYAFVACSGLTSITIPNGVTSIGSSAFSGCSGLTSVTIPNSVTSIGEDAFSGCFNLESISIDAKNKVYDSRNGCNAIIETSSNALITGCKNTVIPESVTSIGGDAFSGCSGLTSIVIPESVTSIGDRAFSGCSSLTSITIPNSVTCIGYQAFLVCSGLTSVAIGSGVTSIGSDAFSGCDNLKRVTINSEGVLSKTYTSGGGMNKIFGSRVKEYIIGDNVTSLGSYAFSGCSDWTLTCLADNPPTAGDNVIDKTSGFILFVPTAALSAYKAASPWSSFSITSLEDRAAGILLKGSYYNYGNFVLTTDSVLTISGSGGQERPYANIPWYHKIVRSIVIEDNVSSIPAASFGGFSNLESIKIGAGVKRIGYSIVAMDPPAAFSGVTEQTKVEFKSVKILCNIDFNRPGDNPLFGSGHLYINGEEVKDLVIPNSVTSIGNFAFYGCLGLTSVTIGSGVTSIGNYAFQYCSGLTSINVAQENTTFDSREGSNAIIKTATNSLVFGIKTSKIPESVTSIGSYAFSGCSGLTSITIPNSVTSIGDRAFSRCSGLTSVTIGNSVTSIGGEAFGGCSGLTKAEFSSIGNLCKIEFDSYYSNPLYYAHHLYVNGNEVKDVVIPNSVTSIGDYAFSRCSSLTSVTIPNSVTSIGDRAFYYCSGLTSITIPNSVTSIGSSAFSGCSSLASVTLGNGVTSIGNNAFENCTGLTKAEFSNIESLCEISFGDNESNPLYYAKHLYVNGNEVKDVVIPNSVTSIGNYAFGGCSGLTSISIPTSVTSIGNYAFSGCSGLKSVTIGNSVTSIGEEAFSGCSGLTSITIPNSVTSIGNYAFFGCSGLNFVTCLAENVPAAESTAFSNSRILYVPASAINEYKTAVGWKIFGSILPLEDKEAGIWAKGKCGENVIFVLTADSVLTISGAGSMTDYEYESSNLPWIKYKNIIKSVEIEDGVTSIGNESFRGCHSLTSITLGNSVTIIGNYAFVNCPNLMSVTIPNSVTNIGKYAFRGCSGLISVTLGNGVTSIGENTFYECSGLTSVTIPESVTSISESAFRACSGLTSVTLNSDAIVSKAYTFINNLDKIFGTQIKEYTIGDKVTSIGNFAFSGCSDLTSVTIGSSVTSIGSGAFSGCSGLTSIVIPESVTSIGSEAFSSCSGLTSVTIGSSVTSIGEYAFWKCSGLKSVTIGNSVTSIGNYAFVSCPNLMSVIIPNSVTSIGSGAFYGCSGLTSITIPNSVTSIGDDAFSGCTNLPVIDYVRYADTYLVEAVDKTQGTYTIKEETRFVGSSAFSGCSRIKSVVIPNSVTSIGDDAFKDCIGIKYVICMAETMPRLDSDVFSGVPRSTAKLYVPSASVDAYKTTSYWKEFSSILPLSGSCGENVNFALRDDFALIISGTGEMTDYSYDSVAPWDSYKDIIKSVVVEDGVTSIGNSAFNGCAGLTSVTISNSVTRIGEFAFESCTGLTSFTIPGGVTTIEDYTFRRCSSLTSVTIPESVTQIGNFVFAWCTSLPSITIPNSVKSIGYDTFSQCTGLTSFNLPNSVTEIGSGILISCPGLTSIIVEEGNPVYDSRNGCNAIIEKSSAKLIAGCKNTEVPEDVTSIGNDAFNGCMSLTSITLPESVTKIGDYAFCDCSGLTSLTCLAEEVDIAGDAFKRVSLSDVTLYVPRSVVSNYKSSEHWSKFGTILGIDIPATSITLNETEKSINQAGQYQLNATILPRTAVQTVTWTSSNPTVATVDENGLVTAQSVGTTKVTATTTDGTNLSASCEVTVTDVIISGKCGENVNYELHADMRLVISGTGAMYDESFTPWYNYRNTIETIEIEEGVTSIGQYAFNGCSGLKSVTIPNSVTSIGEGAFAYCTGLSSVAFGNGVMTIGRYAFEGCSGLTSITIPNSVTTIGDNAFRNCSGLTSVTIPKSVTSIGAWAFNGWFFETITVEEGNTVYDSRNNCNAIIETASGKLLTGCNNSVIPEGVKSIGEGAFALCTGLTSVVLPNSVTGIGYDAFYGCTGLTFVEISGGVTNSARESLKSAASIAPVAANGILTDIGSRAFYGCSALTKVDIPEGVTSIGSQAFYGCSALESINLPETVNSVGVNAFYDCVNLPVTDNLRYADTYLVTAVDNQSTYNIKEETKFIGDNAFEYCDNLTSLTIPESVVTIGSYAFRNCSGLTSVNIPNSVTSIGESAFRDCNGLTSITIPNSVMSMGNNAFSGCDNLTEVTVNSPYVGNFASTFGSQVKKYTLGNKVPQVLNNAFYGCTALTAVVVGNGVERINDKAFSGCTELTSVTLGEKVRWIGENAFQGCCSLNSINIPESVTDIDVNAFGGCDNLPVTNGIRYADTYLVGVLDKTQSGYSIKNGTRFIGSSAFSGCAEMTSIYIPESVETIETGAFALCSGLTALDIPEGIWSIETNAFSGCSALASVTLPASMRSIDKDAFQDCTNLKKVTCLVKETDRSTEDLPERTEPVMPLPGVDPSTLTDADNLYPFNPAHPDDPTLGNVDETTDVTIDNVYPADECKAKWLDYYKKVYNNRTATSKTNTKWTNLSRNPYIKRSDSEVVLKNTYESEWQYYLSALELYEEYSVYKRYTTVPVPSTSVDAFEEVPLSDATLYVYEDVIDAYRVTSPWSKFGQILPIDPLDVKEVKTDKTTVPNEDAPIFDLMGRRLQQKPSSGYYIKGGKKYFVK